MSLRGLNTHLRTAVLAMAVLALSFVHVLAGEKTRVDTKWVVERLVPDATILARWPAV